MEITRRNYDGVPVTGSPHYHSVRAGNLLFISGATAKMTDAEYGDMAAQTEAVMVLIRSMLEEEGGSLDNVVKVNNFVTDISKEATEASRHMRRKYFG